MGRLPFDVANLHPNIEVITSEENLNLFYANNFVLNYCKVENQYRIYPNIRDLSNRESSEYVTTPVSFPDVTIQKGKELQIVTYPEGFRDVCENRLEDESIDCVVTWFFLDTAHNVIEYISLIEKLLTKDGIWVNMGGLDYMYEQFDGQTSIELPYELLKGIIIDLGFVFLKEKTLNNYVHMQDESLLQRNYNCPFFVCKKGGNKV